mmetsp:Transcript_35339/g.89246  ORF Transcript_35339/g.89246 Transcript_35339/m.89246 type:complete len:274 (+) Transcript_35339:559-1380(+)
MAGRRSSCQAHPEGVPPRSSAAAPMSTDLLGQGRGGISGPVGVSGVSAVSQGCVLLSSCWRHRRAGTPSSRTPSLPCSGPRCVLTGVVWREMASSLAAVLCFGSEGACLPSPFVASSLSTSHLTFVWVFPPNASEVPGGTVPPPSSLSGSLVTSDGGIVSPPPPPPFHETTEGSESQRPPGREGEGSSQAPPSSPLVVSPASRASLYRLRAWAVYGKSSFFSSVHPGGTASALASLPLVRFVALALAPVPPSSGCGITSYPSSRPSAVLIVEL